MYAKYLLREFSSYSSKNLPTIEHVWRNILEHPVLHEHNQILQNLRQNIAFGVWLEDILKSINVIICDKNSPSKINGCNIYVWWIRYVLLFLSNSFNDISISFESISSHMYELRHNIWYRLSNGHNLLLRQLYCSCFYSMDNGVWYRSL